MSFWDNPFKSIEKAIKKTFSAVFDSAAWVVDKALGAVVDWLSPDIPEAPDPTRETMVQGGVTKLPVIYGTQKVGAKIIYAGTYDGDRDDDKNDVLTVVAAFCEGPIAEIEEVFFDDVSEHDDRFVTGNDTDWLRIQRNNGDSYNFANSTLISLSSTYPEKLPEWTDDHKLNNVAYCVIRMEYASNPAKDDAQPFTGLPNISARIRGRTFNRVTLVGMNGAYDHYSNPVDCLAEYLTNSRYGMGLPSSEIDWPSFSSVRSICETEVEHYEGAGQHKLFTCNGVLKTDQLIKTNVQTILQSMRGQLIDNQGLLSLRIEGESDPVFDFDKDNTIRAMKGLQFDYFSKKSQEDFFSKEYKVTKLTDRMGMRLEGEKLENIISKNIKSEGITKGSVQTPGDGQPIILLSDHPTIGGYPKIANVITADYDKLVQKIPGSKLKFKLVDLGVAESAFQDYIKKLNFF